MVMRVAATSAVERDNGSIIMTDSVTESTAPIRVELFLRKCAPADSVEGLKETVARCRRLEERDLNADVRVKTWSSVRPALEELSDSGPSVSLTVDAFQSWADREGYTLRSFERRETATMLGRRPAAKILVPTLCVAVYEDDDLQCVAPCSDGDRTYTVDDCLSALEDGVTDAFAGQNEPSATRFDDHPESRTRAEEHE